MPFSWRVLPVAWYLWGMLKHRYANTTNLLSTASLKDQWILSFPSTLAKCLHLHYHLHLSGREFWVHHLWYSVKYFTPYKYCAFNGINIWPTWSPAALGSIPVSSTAIITPLPSYSLYFVRNLSTPVSRLGTRLWAGNGSNSSMAGEICTAHAWRSFLLVAPDNGKWDWYCWEILVEYMILFWI